MSRTTRATSTCGKELRERDFICAWLKRPPRAEGSCGRLGSCAARRKNGFWLFRVNWFLGNFLKSWGTSDSALPPRVVQRRRISFMFVHRRQLSPTATLRGGRVRRGWRVGGGELGWNWGWGAAPAARMMRSRSAHEGGVETAGARPVEDRLREDDTMAARCGQHDVAEVHDHLNHTIRYSSSIGCDCVMCELE